MKPLFDPIAFGDVVHQKMLRDHLSFRDVEDDSGVDHANVYRVTIGGTPNVENYLRLVRWLEQS